MSVIDRALRGPLTDEVPTLTLAEAMTAVLLASVTVDGTVTPNESARLVDMLSTSRFTSGADAAGDRNLAERAWTLLTEDGSAATMTACAKAIPPDLRPTAFALAADLVLADGRISDPAKAFIDELQGVLGLDDGIALKIVEVMLIKNRA